MNRNVVGLAGIVNAARSCMEFYPSTPYAVDIETERGGRRGFCGDSHKHHLPKEHILSSHDRTPLGDGL